MTSVTSPTACKMPDQLFAAYRLITGLVTDWINSTRLVKDSIFLRLLFLVFSTIQQSAAEGC